MDSACLHEYYAHGFGVHAYALGVHRICITSSSLKYFQTSLGSGLVRMHRGSCVHGFSMHLHNAEVGIRAADGCLRPDRASAPITAGRGGTETVPIDQRAAKDWHCDMKSLESSLSCVDLASHCACIMFILPWLVVAAARLLFGCTWNRMCLWEGGSHLSIILMCRLNISLLLGATVSLKITHRFYPAN